MRMILCMLFYFQEMPYSKFMKPCYKSTLTTSNNIKKKDVEQGIEP